MCIKLSLSFLFVIFIKHIPLLFFLLFSNVFFSHFFFPRRDKLFSLALLQFNILFCSSVDLVPLKSFIDNLENALDVDASASNILRENKVITTRISVMFKRIRFNLISLLPYGEGPLQHLYKYPLVEYLHGLCNSISKCTYLKFHTS